MVFVSIAISLAFAVIGELLRPKPKINDPKPTAAGEFNFPTADASRVIPVFWGTCKMQGPNVVWFGDLNVVTLRKKVKTGWFSSKRVVVGFNYYMGVQFVFGYGTMDEFIELRIDDKVAPISNRNFTGDVCSFVIDAPTIIGDDDPPNGVKGPCKLYRGTFSQPPNIYLSSVWNEPQVSAFRPLVHLVMERCYLGNTETPPPIGIIARRCPNPLNLTGGRHNINGDANIACVAYELMTNTLWGMKIPETKIDRDSFIECANILALEGLGISMQQQTAVLGRTLLAEILRHADGVVYPDPVTGLYTMTLAREISDEDKAELPVLDASNILGGTFEFSRSSWELTKNTIIVQYTSRKTFEPTPVQYQDLANIDVRGGMIDAEEFSYLGLSNEVAAMSVAARVSKMKASPLVSAKMSINRSGYRLRPNSGFWLRQPEFGLPNVLMRVIEISYGTLDDPAVKITAMEDIFAVKASAYDAPPESDWTSPVGPLQNFSETRLVEAPAFGSEDLSRRHIIALVNVQGSNATGFNVWTDAPGVLPFSQTATVNGTTPVASLVNDIAATGSETNVSVLVSSPFDLTELDAGESGAREAGENLLLINDEWMAWQSITLVSGTTYSINGVFRGVLDSQPNDHSAGSRVWFVSEGAATTNETGFGSDGAVIVRLVPRNVATTMAVADVPNSSITLASRAQRPMPPARLRVNGAVVGPTASYTGDMTVSWAHRNRQDETIIPQSEPSRTPEPGTTYNIRVFSSTNSLVVSALGVSSLANAATVRLGAAGTYRVEVQAVRAGLTSRISRSAVFGYTPSAGNTSNVIEADEPSYVLDGGGA